MINCDLCKKPFDAQPLDGGLVGPKYVEVRFVTGADVNFKIYHPQCFAGVMAPKVEADKQIREECVLACERVRDSYGKQDDSAWNAADLCAEAIRSNQ